MFKRVLYITFLILPGLVSAPTDSVKLVQTMREFHQDLVKKNTVSINQQTDKALSYGHSNGWIENKNELISHLESGYMKYLSYAEDSIHISFNGNLANARFIADIKGEMNSIPGNYHLKVLEVWVKKGKRWVLFARQAVRG